MERLEFRVGGMAREGCSNAVRRAAGGVAGVADVSADHDAGIAVVAGEDLDRPAILAAVRAAGFGVGDIRTTGF